MIRLLLVSLTCLVVGCNRDVGDPRTVGDGPSVPAPSKHNLPMGSNRGGQGQAITPAAPAE